MPQRVTSDVFVGRTAELAELERALADVLGGKARVALVAGESGVGKSRFATQVRRRAEEAGARALWGDCLELGDGELPYAPIVGALRGLAREGDPVFDELGPARAELARLLPELGVPGDLQIEPLGGSGRGRLFELLLALLDRLGRQQPLLLVLDDLHWADRSTREFLAFLARNLCAERILVLGTYRSDELHRRHPLRPVLAEVERQSNVRRVELQRFTRDELRLALGDILGAPAAEGLVERLWQRSEGVPLFAEELLAAGSDGRGELAGSLRDALMLRVDALPDAAQEALRWVAAGKRVMLEVLQEVSGLDAREVRDGVREAVTHNVLLTHPNGTLSFRHELLREVVADDFLPGEEAELHLVLAEALERRLDGEVCVKPTEAAMIAHHYDQAGERPRALVAAVRAGEAAWDVHAAGEAGDLFERALELWDHVPDAEELLGIDHVELLQRAAVARDDEPARSAELARRALAELDREEEPVRAASLLHRLGRAQWSRGHGEQAFATWDEALDLLPADRPTVLRAKLLARKASSLMLWGSYADADELCQVALRSARAAGSRWAELHALNTRGVCLLALGDPGGAIDTLRAALDGARADGMADQLMRAYINLSDTLLLAGRAEEAHDLLVRGTAEAKELGHHGTWIGFQRAEAAFHLGLWRESDELLPAGSAPRHEGQNRMFFQIRRAELELARGEHDRARERLAQTRESAGQMLEPQWISPIASLLAALHRRERRIDEARDAIDWGLSRLKRGEPGLEDAPRMARILAVGAGVEADAARMARDLGRPGDEAEAAGRAADYAARAIVLAGTRHGRAIPETAAHAAVAEAEAALAGGAPRPELWARAAELWDAMSRPYGVASARWEEAEARLLTGDRAGATEAARTACAVATELGAAWLRDAIEGLARRGRLRLDDGDPAGADGTPGSAAGATAAQPEVPEPATELGLTPRELEVLLLVADGRTNREIGERLFMAEKTASVHVSRILAKLGVRSRTEAAAAAYRLGLVVEPQA
ncbi:AAA family ATPase [Conexibacter sp. SYSU D00693]|uniref:helix-turn-helix transcriptional regulator n=1 Tax=Conexibacter sp. SYSU D00693 TaxID=2812560 RepID=UPI00196B4A29|nr:AAA family ATPase [Conexibacter sp. SYSU D00693]